MTVGIVGAGRMGRALACALAAVGEPVLLSTGRQAASAAPPGPYGEPVPLETMWRGAGVVLLALPFPVALELVRGPAGRAGADRTLVDVTNPRLLPGGVWQPRSGGELIAGAARTWRVAKAFNTVPADALGACRLAGLPISVPVAGEPVARAEASELARRLGFDPVDAGDITASGELESLAVLLLRISTAHRLRGRIGIHVGVPESPPVAAAPRRAG
jgi:8-hydroxy-5-deazaflavin:NADPH oxidoreductase